MNKHLEKIHQIEQLITQAKSNLKNWASQISKYHKTLKSLSQKLESLKNQINMNHPKTQPTKSVK